MYVTVSEKLYKRFNYLSKVFETLLNRSPVTITVGRLKWSPGFYGYVPFWGGWCTVYKGCGIEHLAYLPGVEVNRDHRGGSSRARPIHCTWNRLTPASIPNVDTSGAEFLLAGTAYAPSLILK